MNSIPFPSSPIMSDKPWGWLANGKLAVDSRVACYTCLDDYSISLPAPKALLSTLDLTKQ
jgi:hypothetical protein